MRGKLLTAIFALALAAMLAMSGALYSAAAGFTLSGETLLGSRDEAGPFALEYSLLLGGHGEAGGRYFPASGEGEGYSPGWSYFRRSLSKEDAEPSLQPFMPRLHYTLSIPRDGSFPEGEPEWARRLYSELLSDWSGLSARIERPAEDYLEALPLAFDGSGVYTADGSLGMYSYHDSFLFDCAEGFTISALLSSGPGGYQLTINTSGGGSLGYTSSCAEADGDLYLLLTDFRWGGHGQKAETLSPELLPGGGWGIFRIPCSPGDEGGLEADLSAAERVLALPEGYEGLISAGEAGELLMLGLEGGEYALRVLDTASGALSEPVSLAEARADEFGSGAEIFYSGGLLAAVDNGTLIAALREDGSFRPFMSCGTDALPVSGRVMEGAAGPAYFVYDRRFAFDGGRLAMLEAGLYADAYAEPDGYGFLKERSFMRLTVFGGGGAVCCEWLDAGLPPPSLPDNGVETRLALSAGQS